MTTLVSIAQGGTGANNVVSALSNLGAANSAAYDQANNAYAQANSAFGAANNAQVTVYQNSASSITTQRINFVNTATITVSISNDSGNANVALTAVGGAAYDQANAAYSAANGAYGQANGAYAQANGAYAQANGAYGQANIAYGQANAAYGQANAAYAEANLKLNLSGGAIVGDVSITGNLFVNGAQTIVNTNSLTVNDPIFLLANNNTTNSVGLGFVAHYGPTQQHSGLIRAHQDNNWYLFEDYDDHILYANNVLDTGNIKLATLKANINANSLLLVGNTVATQANLTLAHDTANGAYAQANGAYGQANGAFGAANVAYGRANSAANTVMVSANSGSTLINKSLNFINTSSVLVTVNDALDGNANVSFTTLSGANAVSSSFTADGVGNTYTMGAFAVNANNVLVTIDGVILTPGTEYTTNGTTLTILYVPANGSKVETRTITGGGDGGSASLGFVRSSFVGNGSNLNFTLSSAPVDEDNCLVFVDRVLQRNSEYNVSASTLQFVSAPDNGAVIDAFVSQYLATDAAVIKTGDTMTGNLNVAATLITQNIVPNLNVTYDLGTSTKRFKDLYLSNSTIYLGDATISANGGNLTFSGATLNTATANISTIITGNALTLATGTASNGNIIFSANGAESMRIVANGFVAIGTTSPARKFHTFNNTEGFIARFTGGSSSNVNIGIFGNSVSPFASIGSESDHDFRLFTNGVDRLSITSSGNVGIGTVSPVTLKSTLTTQILGNLKLGSANDTGLLSLGDIASTGANAGVWRGAGGAFGSAGNFLCIGGWSGVTFTTGNSDISSQTERMRITDAGNVGIGTTSPGTPLTVFSGTAGTDITGTVDSIRLHVPSYNNGSRQTIEWFQTSSSLSLARFGIEWNQTTSLMNFVWRDVYNGGAGSTELMRLTGAGNVGIGVTNPNGKLQFAPDINPRKIVLYEGANNNFQFYGFGVESATLVYSTFSTGDDHVFYNGTGSSTRQELMRINSTHKAVQIPGQPGFKQAWQSRSATGSTRILGTNQGDALSASGRDQFNQGGYFNTATGRFTCPVAGMYMFGISAMRFATDGSVMDIRIKKNNGLMWARTYVGAYTSAYEHSMLVTITDAAVNDYFEFEISPTTSLYDDDTYIYGYLIG